MHECATVGCGRKSRARGLCAKCYARVQKRVTLGQTTWEDAEANGIEKAAEHPAIYYDRRYDLREARERDKKKCLIAGCNRTAKARGLCWPCYQQALRWMKRTPGSSWQQLIDIGCAAEPKPREKTSAFSKIVTRLNQLVSKTQEEIGEAMPIIEHENPELDIVNKYPSSDPFDFPIPPVDADMEAAMALGASDSDELMAKLDALPSPRCEECEKSLESPAVPEAAPKPLPWANIQPSSEFEENCEDCS